MKLSVGYMKFLAKSLYEKAEEYERKIPYIPEGTPERAILELQMEGALEASAYAEECYENKTPLSKEEIENEGELRAHKQRPSPLLQPLKWGRGLFKSQLVTFR